MEIKPISLTTSQRSPLTSRLNVLKDFVLSILNVLVVLTRKIFSTVMYLVSSRKRKSFTKNSMAETTGKRRIGFKGISLKQNKKLKVVLYIIMAGLLVYAGVQVISGLQKEEIDDGKVEVKGATASQEINREFSFPLRNGEGEEISKILYNLEKVESRDEIIVKGKRANSIKGRTFLILTLKIKNEYQSSIEMDTKDYIRLSVNGNKDEWLAADIHNDPVKIQAISTKFTRLGFPINEEDRDLVLRVGEINGDKEEIELNLQ